MCENAKPGNPASEWDVQGAGDASIQGFATDISVDQGQTVSFKIDTDATAYRLDIYRMGYYNGMGARLVATINGTGPHNQPACLTDSATGLIDCGNWSVSRTWTVPADAVSGIYFAKATRLDTGGASHIVFIVRDDDGRSDLLFQTSDTTWQAYNQWGGNSLYVGNPAGRAYKVSYNRPFSTRATSPEDWAFNAEYPMVRWLEANGYWVSYSTGVDSDRRGSEILEHKVFLSVGHDEYWSGAQRTAVENARNAGVHLAFFSGNEIFWKTRWENSISAGGAQYRTLVTYKETHANAKIDPLPNVWTGTWRDPRFSPPADGGRPENALTGTIFYVNSGTSGIRVPAAEGKMRFWRNTSVANLAPGTFATMPDGTLGYEWDEDRDNGFRPPGLIRLSDTTVSGVDYLQDFGSTYGPGTANHALTLYRHSSGALVFGAGTVQWSWGLDSNHDRGNAPPSLAMQQATINLFADMGVHPLTPQSGVTTASPSTDTLAPSSTITLPVNGGTVPANSTITITGTATDVGGGVVGGVEVSVDGGLTWRRATGRNTWTYIWQTGGARTVTLFSRAVDDSGNLEQPLAGVSVTVGAGTATCPCSLWLPTQAPTSAPDADQNPIALGTRFRSDVSGFITAIRFYKHGQNTGTHTGSLWTANGTLLSSVTFTNESTSGWQEAQLPSPVAIAANTMYVVSYHTSSGFYAGEDGYFALNGIDNGPLHAPADGTQGPNGVYAYGGPNTFPNQTYSSESYWVDVVFVTSIGPDTTPPNVLAVSPANGTSGVSPNPTVTATFSENVQNVTGATFQLRDSSNSVVPATVSYSAGTRTATLTPNTALAFSTTYTARLDGGAGGITDAAGNPLATDYTWSFTTSAAPPPPPNEGPGGPILVVGSTSNPFSRYYAEILRAEGLNAFFATDISQVTASSLNAYDVVILGAIPLTTTQVTMFSNWVNAGGNLIVTRPDKKLASLLGLTDLGTTLSDAYMLVNTATAPGAGIVGETIQFHGPADRYSLNGATAVAMLYSDATTATSNPAVTIRSVGSSGGQAASFTFDLARSIVLTRQGNPSWSGQERDGVAPIRSDDLFFGGAQSDWVDLNKVAIPQADEQQRLLANLIGFMNDDRKPLPRFWYFPRGEKAVVVMTGDDHGNNGTAGRFDVYKSNSPAGCSVDNWECVRATSYIFPDTPMSPAQAAAYSAEGFEIAVHITTNCADFTPASLESNYSNDLAAFLSEFPGLPPVRTNRTHCITWSDYDTQPQVALAHGIRLDTNYYYWPGSWVQDRPGFMTGSGMPMRFTKADGTIIDVYQAATQLTDESAQSWPFTIDTLLDRALGAEGFYGFFTANMHTDTVAHVGSEAIVASAQARSVPIISARQLLTWLDGRNGSSFGNITWNGSILGFSISVGNGANGLEAMLPTAFGASTLTGITRGGSTVPYRVETIKGVSYAIFPAAAGNYAANYAVDATPPTISGLTATPSTLSATVTWTTNEAADSRVEYGLAPDALTQSTTISQLTTVHSVTLTGLTGGTTYYYRARSADQVGNAAFSPAPPAAPASFTTTTPPPLNCPCTLWPTTQVPSSVTVQDPSAVELGVKFRTSVDGYITGLRFYKGPQNTGTHTGNLWTSSGALLASGTFANETASGWQTLVFSQPVPVTANTTYVASYHTPSGFYSADGGYFATAFVNGPLEALASPTSGGNGVYLYGSGGFPTNTFNAANYWVDVIFNTSVSADTTPPVISGLSATPGNTSATINWQTDELATSRVDYGLSPQALTLNVTLTGERLSHGVQLTGLAEGTTYYYRVTSADGAGNAASAPAQAATFTTTAPSGPVVLTDTTVAHFAAGTPGSGIYIGEDGDGEVMLQPALGVDFTGTSLPPGWSSVAWNSGGTATVAGGAITVDGARTGTDADFGAGQSLEFTATFGTEAFRHVGFGVSFNETPWAMFSTGAGNALYARTHNGAEPIDTLLDGNWLGAPHRFRIDWNPSSVVFSIDGTVVASHNVTIGTPMRPLISDFDALNGGIQVNSLRMAPYATAGTFVSRVLDAGAVTDWASMAWTGSNAASIGMAIRFGNTPTPDGSWTSFVPVPSSGAAISGSSRYVQYQATLSGDGTGTPTLDEVTITAQSAAPIPEITVSDVNVVEGNSGTQSAVFTVQLSQATTAPVTVSYSTANGSAAAPGDYLGASGVLTFQPGTTSLTVSVTVNGDTTVEPDETFTLELSSPINGTIADPAGVATIANDDALPSLSISNVTVTEGNSGSVNAVFAVTLSAASTQTVTVDYATANDTAIAPGDYSSRSGTLTFNPGTTSLTVTVPVLGDTLDEANETFTIGLSGPTNATIADGEGIGTITDNDATPSLSITNASVTEGNTGSVNAVFTVNLSAASGRTVTVNYATTNGTAQAPADYTTRSGTLTFDPGTTSLTITVPVNGDTLDESSETFNVNLSGAVNASISDSLGVGTINDNDPTPSLVINNISITEGNSGTKTATFTVTLSAASGRVVTVRYATANGSASSPSDYTSTSGTLTFNPGTTTQPIAVTIRGDRTDEPNQTFVVNLSNASNATIADSQGVCTIVNDD